MFTLSASSVQGQVQFNFESKSVAQGSSFTLNCSVKNFKNVAAFSFEVDWSPDVLNATGFASQASEININTSSYTLLPEEGKLIIQWLEQDVKGINLDDNTILFSIDFVATGSKGNSTEVAINPNANLSWVVLDPDVNKIDKTQTPGTVTIEGGTAGPTVNFDLGSVTGQTNDFVTLPITVRNFTNVGGFQFSINFDPGFLEYDSNELFVNGLSIGDDQDLTSAGQLVFQFNQPSGELTLDNNSEIGRLKFKVLASSGSSNVRFSSNPLQIIISASDPANVYTFKGANGKVTVETSTGGNGCDVSGMALYADTESGESGTEVCVPVKVKDFKAAVVEGTIGWDKRLLTFKKVDNLYNGDEVKTNSFAQDSLAFFWVSGTGENQTISDGTILFEICFQLTGDNGSSSTINFVDLIASDETSDLTISSCSGAVNIGGSTLDISLSKTPPSCQEEPDGSLKVNLSNPADYTYAWYSGNNKVSSTQELTGVPAGTYNLIITDKSGKEVVNQEISLSAKNPIKITSSSIKNSSDGTDGSIQINVTGGEGQLSFLWSNGATTQNLNNIGGGTYSVVITDSKGCTLHSEQFTVGGESGSLSVSAELSNFNGFGVKCFGEESGVATMLISGGALPITFTFSQGKVEGDGPVFENLKAGVYKYKAKDADGVEVTGEFEITEPPAITTSPEITPDDGTGTGSVDLKATGGVGRLTYSWDDENNSTTAFLRNLEKGRYTVRIKDDNACTYVKNIYIPLEGETCFPEQFIITPNEDGKNDVLSFPCLSLFNQSTLSIYDRWGVLQYEISDYQNDWNGVDDRGTILPDAGYLYVLRLTDGDGVRSIYKGSVTLINKLR